jgi:cytochrome P450
MGLPVEDGPFIDEASRDLARGRVGGSVDDFAVAVDACSRLQRYFELATAAASGRGAAEGFLHAAAAARGRGEIAISDQELVSTCIFLVLAGYRTLASFLEHATRVLRANPFAALAMRESDHGPVLRELWRLYPPIVGLTRVATKDTAIGQHELRRGEWVTLSLYEANRDPTRYVDATEMRLMRRPQSLSFGWGVHACPGAQIANIVSAECLRNLAMMLADAAAWQLSWIHETGKPVR